MRSIQCGKSLRKQMVGESKNSSSSISITLKEHLKQWAMNLVVTLLNERTDAAWWGSWFMLNSLSLVVWWPWIPTLILEDWKFEQLIFLGVLDIIQNGIQWWGSNSGDQRRVESSIQLPLFPGPLTPEVVVPVRVLSMVYKLLAFGGNTWNHMSANYLY